MSLVMNVIAFFLNATSFVPFVNTRHTLQLGNYTQSMECRKDMLQQIPKNTLKHEEKRKNNT